MGEVDLSIGLVTFEVFVTILDGCGKKDDDDWEKHETWADCAEEGEELEDCDGSEETGRQRVWV